jgi:hypothetical protein
MSKLPGTVRGCTGRTGGGSGFIFVSALLLLYLRLRVALSPLLEA